MGSKFTSSGILERPLHQEITGKIMITESLYLFTVPLTRQMDTCHGWMIWRCMEMICHSSVRNRLNDDSSLWIGHYYMYSREWCCVVELRLLDHDHNHDVLHASRRQCVEFRLAVQKKITAVEAESSFQNCWHVNSCVMCLT